MGPFQPSMGCLHSKTASLNVIPGQVDVKHICNKLLKSQHDQATPLASTRGVVSVEFVSVKLWAHSIPAGVVYTPKLQIFNAIPGQVDAKHICNKILKS